MEIHVHVDNHPGEVVVVRADDPHSAQELEHTVVECVVRAWLEQPRRGWDIIITTKEQS